MGRFNKVTPSKSSNSNKSESSNWKNTQSDRKGSTDSFVVSKYNSTKTNLNNQEGFKVTKTPKNKKPFDKKTWRLQKYSKKYKLDQWEEKRKKAILRGYYKEIKDEPKIDVKKIYEQYDSDEEPHQDDNKNNDEVEIETKGKKPKNKAFNKAKLELERLKQEKVDEKEKRIKQKEEREEALKLYKKKKNEKFKRLNKKTKRGQPIMKDRIEMLLEKIQST